MFRTTHGTIGIIALALTLAGCATGGETAATTSALPPAVSSTTLPDIETETVDYVDVVWEDTVSCADSAEGEGGTSSANIRILGPTDEDRWATLIELPDGTTNRMVFEAHPNNPDAVWISWNRHRHPEGGFAHFTCTYTADDGHSRGVGTGSPMPRAFDGISPLLAMFVTTEWVTEPVEYLGWFDGYWEEVQMEQGVEPETAHLDGVPVAVFEINQGAGIQTTWWIDMARHRAEQYREIEVVDVAGTRTAHARVTARGQMTVDVSVFDVEDLASLSRPSTRSG